MVDVIAKLEARAASDNAPLATCPDCLRSTGEGVGACVERSDFACLKLYVTRLESLLVVHSFAVDRARAHYERAKSIRSLDVILSTLLEDLQRPVPGLPGLPTLHFLDRDDSGHWYLVDAAKRQEWAEWSAREADDELGWAVPAFAERLNGSPSLVTFANPARQ